MILKIKHNDSWEFIDQIDRFVADGSEAINPLPGTCPSDKPIMVHYERKGEYINLCMSEPCYLLNDNGKTIERIS